MRSTVVDIKSLRIVELRIRPCDGSAAFTPLQCVERREAGKFWRVLVTSVEAG